MLTYCKRRKLYWPCDLTSLTFENRRSVLRGGFSLTVSDTETETYKICTEPN